MPIDTLSVTVNGEPRRVPAGTSVSDLLHDAGLPADKVAVEVNRRIRRGTDYDRPLEDGDAVEIVTFVGGG